MRRFHLHRIQDVSGVSGVGIVAEGCVFTDGSVVVRWMGPTPSTVVWDSLGHMEKIHLHNGATKVIWKDE